MKNKPYTPTQTLLEALSSHEAIDSFFEEHDEVLGLDTFTVHLRKYLHLVNYDIGAFNQKTRLNPSYGYQLINGTRSPSRDKIIQIALGLNLDLDSCNALLRSADKQPLYAKQKRDAVLIFSMLHNFDLDQANQSLVQNAFTPLF